jgi:hypothetical protein
MWIVFSSALFEIRRVKLFSLIAVFPKHKSALLIRISFCRARLELKRWSFLVCFAFSFFILVFILFSIIGLLTLAFYLIGTMASLQKNLCKLMQAKEAHKKPGTSSPTKTSPSPSIEKEKRTLENVVEEGRRGRSIVVNNKMRIRRFMLIFMCFRRGCPRAYLCFLLRWNRSN